MDMLLEIQDLSVTFTTDDGLVHAVDNVSLSIARGEILGLVGESGCGKSVASMSILRLIPSPPGHITSGSVLFEGRDLLSLPVHELREIRGDAISIIFQEPMTALSPLHRVGSQLIETLRAHREMPHREAWNAAVDWLRRVGIPDPGRCMHTYPFQLSGGMRQRVMIAGAFLLDPQLIIADEPTTALDVTIQAQVLDLMREMKKQDTSVLLITHDMGVIWEMCTRVSVMYASEIVETAAVSELFENPLHPYTEALLESIPAVSAERGELHAIEGQVPSPLDYPQGCRFRERCRYAFDRCRNEHPSLYASGQRHARCFLRDPDAPASRGRVSP